MGDYIAIHCQPHFEATKDGTLEIKDVIQLPLKTILFTITQFPSSATINLATKTKM